MDPNETLRLMREALESASAFEQMETPMRDAMRLEALGEAAACAESLDEWLSKGGFMPRAWNGARSRRVLTSG